MSIFRIATILATLAVVAPVAASPYTLTISGIYAPDVIKVWLSPGTARIVSRNHNTVVTEVTMPEGMCNTRVRLQLSSRQMVETGTNACANPELTLR